MIAKLRKLTLVLAAILAVCSLSSCRDDDEINPEPINGKTLFIYMPWSSNLTNHFRTNIDDIEKAILQKGLTNERVIVFFSKSGNEAEMYEIVPENGSCRHNPIKLYQEPRLNTVEGLTEILLDMRQIAPAEQFAMIIGCHGMGWLPVRVSSMQGKVPAFRPHFDYTDVPLTRYFGGLSSEYQTDISTLRESLQRAALHMQFILFDDCYMSSIEVAYELRQVTDRIIACPTEIMAFGMPYATIGQHLIGQPDYRAVCTEFYCFYSSYLYPYGTIGITDCSQLDALADIVREINLRFGDSPLNPAEIQRMDGYTPVIFFDFKDYIEHLCPDLDLLSAFRRQFELAVPYSAHTTRFYSATRGAINIDAFCGITTSAPTQSAFYADWTKTSWYDVTH